MQSTSHPQSCPLTVGIYTLGCKVNQYESEAIAELLCAQGLDAHPAHPSEICDAYIINTCTVTAESDRKARQFIRRALSHNAAAYIVVTGCLAQTNAQSICSIAGVDAVVGNRDKLTVVSELRKLIEQGEKNAAPCVRIPSLDDAPFEEMSIRDFSRTRAYIKIEDGCESHCTYCIIPAARGQIRSKRAEDVLQEVSLLSKNGCREVVLTGIETASWGKDLGGADLADLLCAVDAIQGIGRVRLGSLDPSLMKEPFVKCISALSSLAPHFHLSIQSGSSSVLARMRRKYNRDQALAGIARLRAAIPDVMLTTDIIVGFPGESDEEFADTLDFVRRARFLMVHIFPYSPRAGTIAAQMPDQIPAEVKHARLSVLDQTCAQIRAELLTEIIRRARPLEVLFESYFDGIATGHTPNFVEVRVPSERPLGGCIRAVHPLSLDSDGVALCGTLLPLIAHDQNESTSEQEATPYDI
ncbi:MAG: tRNA (N(6)-L-threonylcarbamoyladenosine(37)-C(2))-methylthiotransferase MtaB [Clostridia bacterium]|nr:tRNA (N(6)-L-threonylcarbamoyladenosine(37)-C(2))-methylthiotransferase MtaB [Clostridia bacterium]